MFLFLSQGHHYLGGGSEAAAGARQCVAGGGPGSSIEVEVSRKKPSSR